MTIRNKISLTYAILTAIILISLSLAVYYLSYSYTKRDFYNRLKERINITAQYMLTDDNSNKIIEELRKNFLRSLPQEKEYLYNQIDIKSAEDFPDSVKNEFDQSFLEEIFFDGHAETGAKEFSAVGMTYKDHHGEFVIIVSAYDNNGFAKLANLRNVLVSITLFFIIFSYFIGNWYAKQNLLPIAKIIDKVNQIRVSKLNTRLELPKEQDEIYDLIFTFNQMLDRLENAIATQNNFISNASHELKNPLTAILGSIEIALNKTRSTEEYIDFLNKIAKDATKLETLTLRLLRLAQTNLDETAAQKEQVRIDELLIDLKSDFAASHPEGKFNLHLGDLPENPSKLTIWGNEELLKICFSQIIENSFKFSETMVVELQMIVNEKDIKLIFTDHGIGIPKKEQAEIFVPFFRASNVRKYRGFGIGLPMAKRILDLHQSTIYVISDTNQGTTFHISIPIWME